MSLTAYEKDIVANVAKFGCHITSVAGDEEQPGFSYSTGFWESLDAPEVVALQTALYLPKGDA